MCGMTGFIGKSTNPDFSHNLITRLFEKTEARGEDASGFWGTSKNNTVFYKKPIKSSEMIEKNLWKDLKDKDLDLLITHCRAATPGAGKPEINVNNHPFVSDDSLVGLIHNGNISEEYEELKDNFNLSSECDSEILLHLYESVKWDYSPAFDDMVSKFGTHIAKRIAGIRNIWRQIKKGRMAVAIGEKLEQERCLWLFRNEHRSLWMADLREEVGQLFFFSTPEIWDEAVNIPKKMLIEIPPEEIWLFKYPCNITPGDEHFHRFKLVNYKQDLSLQEDAESAFEEDIPDIFHIVTDQEKELLEFNCNAIADLALDINTVANNDLKQGNICNFEDLISNVDDIKRDMENVMRLLSNGYY